MYRSLWTGLRLGEGDSNNAKTAHPSGIDDRRRMRSMQFPTNESQSTHIRFDDAVVIGLPSVYESQHWSQQSYSTGGC